MTVEELIEQDRKTLIISCELDRPYYKKYGLSDGAIDLIFTDRLKMFDEANNISTHKAVIEEVNSMSNSFLFELVKNLSCECSDSAINPSDEDVIMLNFAQRELYSRLKNVGFLED